MGALLRQYYANKQREWISCRARATSDEERKKKKKAPNQVVKRRSYSMKNERLLSLAAAPHR